MQKLSAQLSNGVHGVSEEGRPEATATFASPKYPTLHIAGAIKEHKSTKSLRTTHHWVNVGRHTQSILKKNKHWSKALTASNTGIANLFETESYFLGQVYAKRYQFDTHTSEIQICSICLQLCYH